MTGTVPHPGPDDQLLDLLERWQSGCAAGREPAPEELTADPALRAELRRAIAAAKRLRDGLSADTPSDGPAPEAPTPPLAPPGYDLLGPVGEGGMGVVYRARDRAMDRTVAVKVLHPRFAPDSATARRFVEEAHITGQLQHPGVPAVYHVGGLPDGRPFLAMKLIKGDTLADLLKSTVAVNRLAVFEAVAQAVGYAHAHDVIHRDLKPHNVMVGAFGEVQVMDWGLAKVLGGVAATRGGASDPDATTAPTAVTSPRDADTPYTQYGSAVGTPAYMPPEQAAGELDKVGPASDVFGLGAILCALLTGRPPFEGRDAEAVRLNAVRGRTEGAFAQLDASGADPGVVALCKRCLAFEPADRPANANEVAREVAALRAAAEERARQAERDRLAAEVRAAEQAKRRRAVQWAAGAVAAVLLLGTAATTAGLLRANAARKDAETARQAEAKQKQAAVEKEAEASAVVKFFEDKVFAAGRPKGYEGGLGKDATLQEAITASLPALATGFKDQPLVEARLRAALGKTFDHLGDFQAAAGQFERARATYAEWRGPDHPDTLQIMSGLAKSYYDLARDADALRLREETLAGQKRVLGQNHPDTLRSMQYLAMIFHALHRDEDALKLQEEALATCRRVLGSEHEGTLESMRFLAYIKGELGLRADSLKLAEEVFATSRRVFGPDHPLTVDSMDSLALAYAALDRHADALELQEATLAASKRLLPPDHRDTLHSMNNLARTYFALGRHSDALKLFEETLAGRNRANTPAHPDTLFAMHELAKCYSALDRHEDALKQFEAELAARKQSPSPDHPRTLLSMCGVAGSQIELNRGAVAIPLIDECVARAAGKGVDPNLIPRAMNLRLRHFQKVSDPAGCRATAEMWERLNRPDADSLYAAARMRAAAAGVYAKAEQPAEAAADADRAMAWLTQAVAAGYKDRLHMGWDKDLAHLRPRADFRAMLASLPPTREAAPWPVSVKSLATPGAGR